MGRKVCSIGSRGDPGSFYLVPLPPPGGGADLPAPFQPVGKKRVKGNTYSFQRFLILTFHWQELNHKSPLVKEAGKYTLCMDSMLVC